MEINQESTFQHSLIVPIYNNAENIKNLINAIGDLNAKLNNSLEVVFVIDGSPDNSGQILLGMRPSFSFASQIAFHSRNFGSFTAVRTGLELARGNYIAVMAADLQEPPGLILEMFEVLKSQPIDIVFGQRSGRHDGFLRDLMSNAFWTVYRKLVVKDIPQGGVDIFACNQKVRLSILDIKEPNSSLIAQLFWVGYNRQFIPYHRREREHGKSGWSFTKRLRYMMDSIFSFSDLPIIAVLWIGIIGVISSILFSIVLTILRVIGYITEPGYTAIVILISFFGSVILLVQGIIGSYLWRTFENTKQRPLRIISHLIK